jgi:hypothetical protein
VESIVGCDARDFVDINNNNLVIVMLKSNLCGN